MSDDDKPDLTAVLEHYDVATKDRASYMTRCPLHEDRTPSLSVNTTKDLWNCHSCGEKGDAYSLIQLKEDCSFVEARQKAKALGLATGTATEEGGEESGSAYGGRRKKARGPGSTGSSYVPAWRR